MFKKILASKTLFIFLIVIFIFSLVSLTRELNRHSILAKKISVIENYIDYLKSQNIKLTAQLGDLSSNVFQEKQAREKLGLQKPGEKVIIITRENLPETISKSDESFSSLFKKIKKTTSKKEWGFVSSFKNWVNYFFNKN